ncbi:MAG: T9SS type A sorting domain-containing protein [Bacteroidales bacterium]|jgi:hypothetical protein|nr:T9SS type A sorting domain-containing protein [Bacteroidales bacterium]
MMKNFYFKHIFVLFVFCFATYFSAFSQFKITPYSFNSSKENTKKSNKDIKTTFLPFIDDFSSYKENYNNGLWENKGALFNTNYPIMPPSVGVITLDALDEDGILYPLANTTGFACDTISSCFIRLDSSSKENAVLLQPKDSIYLSFFVQPSGGMGNLWETIGSAPSKKDSLVLQFYSLGDNSWNTVWKTEGLLLDSIYSKDSNYWLKVVIPITEDKYFNNSFRFRFVNFASLDNNPSYSYVSNCDQWHIDYVFLDKARKFNESIRDIAFVFPAYSLLKQYQAMPKRQFTLNDMGDSLNIGIINLSDEALNSIYKYVVFDENGSEVISYDGGFENIYPYSTTKLLQTNSNHAHPKINFSYSFNGDNWTYFDIVHFIKPGVGEDENTKNDTIVFRQIFENYFAYDDNSAENGFGIEPIKNSNLALGFTLNEEDTLTAVDIYFNSTYQNANEKPFYICVWDSENGMPNDSIYHSYEYFTPSFDGLNRFHRYYLEHPLLIPKGDFFISLQTKYADYLNVGFDRNTNSSYRTFGNWTNAWQRNNLFEGSLMIRPYFGYKAIIGLENIAQRENFSFSLYPNPAKTKINISLNDNKWTNSFSSFQIRIIDMLSKERLNKKFTTSIDVSFLENGIYIVEIINKKTKHKIREKLIIRR